MLKTILVVLFLSVALVSQAIPYSAPLVSVSVVTDTNGVFIGASTNLFASNRNGGSFTNLAVTNLIGTISTNNLPRNASYLTNLITTNLTGIVATNNLPQNASYLTNITATQFRTTNAPANGNALRYTNGNLYWAP